jgi:hypothetical protein
LKNNQWAAAAALLIVAVTAALIPLWFIVGFELWWPATIGRENYSLYVTAFPMMEHGYFFARNAFLFSLLFAYPATLIDDLFFKIFPDFTEFNKFGAFGVTMYVLYAIAIIAVCSRAIFSKHLLAGEKLMLLWVAFGYQPLTLLIRNFTEINYHMLEAILYTSCAGMTIRWLWTDEAPKRSTVWIAGAAAALAIGAKLTFAVTMAPFFLIVCVAIPGSWRGRIRSLGEFCLSAVLCGSVLLLAYLEFHITYVRRFLRDLAGLNTSGGWLVQHVDAVASGLREGFTTGSIMYGFCMSGAILIGTALIAFAMCGRLPTRCRLFVSVSVIVLLFFVAFAYLRMASNTFADFTLWILFDLAILASMIMRLSAFHRIALVETAGLLYVCAVTTYYTALGLPESVAFWKSQSESGRAIDALIEQRSVLPIIYYLPDNPGLAYQFVFPSVDLIPVLSGDRQPIEDLYMRHVRPRVSFAAAGNGLRAGAQIAVIPEKIDGVELSDLSPEFRQFLTSPNCSAINWGDGIFRGRSRVTVCVVHEPLDASAETTSGIVN